MDSMKSAMAFLAGLLFQSPPSSREGAPFEGAGTIISTQIPCYRPPAADAERAFDVEGSHLKKWLRIPAALDKELQAGVCCWAKGLEKDGVFHVSEAVAFPGDGIPRLKRSAQNRDCSVTFDSVGGGCDHMPYKPVCNPTFWGLLTVKNRSADPVRVGVERILWSENLDRLGVAADRITPMLLQEGKLSALPCELEGGKDLRISLPNPVRASDPHGSSPLRTTVVLSVGGERLIVQATGEFRISR
jgi:hypothetical protein